MDIFTLIVVVGMVGMFLAILALGLWHPRSGADLLDWKPTRSPEVEAQNEIDDVAQMIAAQNRMRERRGAATRTKEEIEEQVKADRREMNEYADAYWEAERAKRVEELNTEGAITVYEKTSCSNCQRLARILSERGIDFDRIDYHIDPLPRERIAELLGKAGIGPRDALRMKEPGAQELVDRDASDEDILEAMEADPVLLQRPIVERGDRAVLARPAERVLDLL